MRKIYVLVLGILSFAMMSCEQLQNMGLSEDEIVKGLKTALQVGADSSVTITSAVNGYYKDELLKIALPPEADVIVENIEIVKDLGLDLTPYVEDVVISMNRAAESAAKKAAPIFANAITSLSITDGLSILNGTNPVGTAKSASGFDSIAATHYLISTTYDNLVAAYQAPVNEELDKDLGLGFSSNEAWGTLTSKYNVVANSFAGQLAGLDPVNSNLGEWVTGKALDGLFLKVGDQERSIRRDPWQWISNTAGDVGDILQKVFGGE